MAVQITRAENFHRIHATGPDDMLSVYCPGRTGVWTDTWRWYGSHRALEDTGEPEFVTCSARTRRGDRLAPEPRP